MPIDLTARRSVTAGNGFSVLPDRQYIVTIEDVSAKETKDGDDMVTVKMRVNSGQPFANRCVFANFVVGHSDQRLIAGDKTIAQIAQERLDALLVAARGEGDWALTDLESAVVTIKTKNGDYHYPVARAQATTPVEVTADEAVLPGELDDEETDAPPF